MMYRISHTRRSKRMWQCHNLPWRRCISYLVKCIQHFLHVLRLHSRHKPYIGNTPCNDSSFSFLFLSFSTYHHVVLKIHELFIYAKVVKWFQTHDLKYSREPRRQMRNSLSLSDYLAVSDFEQISMVTLFSEMHSAPTSIKSVTIKI